MSSLAHFTGVYILQRGCFSVCSFCKAVVGRDGWNRQKLSTHVFSFVANRKCYLFVWVKADNYKINELTTKE